MTDPGTVLYADTSALVKLVVRERESEALEQELEQWPFVSTSVITEIELGRAVARARAFGAVVADQWVVLGILAATAEMPLSDDIRDMAATLEPLELRALDAIHLASAMSLGGDLNAVLTYDSRMASAARKHDIAIIRPG